MPEPDQENVISQFDIFKPVYREIAATPEWGSLSEQEQDSKFVKAVKTRNSETGRFSNTRANGSLYSENKTFKSAPHY